jgi:hypothetical protein
MLFLSGCSRRVHHMATTTSMEGAMEASKAPMMNRNTAIPAKLRKADMMVTDAPQQTKQKQIQ